jgi:hypothetical protein
MGFSLVVVSGYRQRIHLCVLLAWRGSGALSGRNPSHNQSGQPARRGAAGSHERNVSRIEGTLIFTSDDGYL